MPFPRSSESVSGRIALRVLFFEDNADDVELSLRALKSANFDVVSDVAVTQEEVVEYVRSRRYDVILSDFHMPQLSGMEAFDLLRKEGLNIPFILVTGSVGDEKAVECLKEGVADYVLKDRLVRLPVAVRRALDEYRLRLEGAQAAQALRCSEASYRSLIQSAPCGILRLSATDGRLLEGNAALSEMLGYGSSASLLECSAAGGIFLNPELLKRITAGRVDHGQAIESEIEWKRQDGTPLIVKLSGRLLCDRRGNPDCLEMIAENITERQHAQERIRQLNRLYSVLSHAGRAIVQARTSGELFEEICRIIVEDGRFQMAWAGLADTVTGAVIPAARCPRDTLYLAGLLVTANDEPSGHGPVGSAIRESCRVVCNDLMTDRRMQPWRERAVRHGYRSVAAFPLRVQGRTIGAIAIYAGEVGFFDPESIALLDELAADLSFALERIEAEEMRRRAVEELDQFFALSLDMLCISNFDGYIHRLNPAWERTLGFNASEMRSTPLMELVHPEDRWRAEAACRKLRSGIEIDHFEFRVLSKGGSYRWLIGSAAPALERGLVFAAVSDITDRKYLEEQLRSQNVALAQQNRRANEASRLKSQFLANMSHELRSPLNGIIGFAELLYDGKLGPVPERPREFLGRIHASASHLLQLINGVLDLSKVEAGRLEFRPEPVSVSGIVQEVTGILGSLAADKRIQVETGIEAAVERVTIDAGRLKQILYNYLSNALKFTEQGGRIAVSVSEEGSSEFRLEVSDSGVGICADDIPRLFVEFQQLDATAAKRYQGTGLGLALTKRIVEAQGGRVGVRSTPGNGSTFFAVLPRVPSPDGGGDIPATILTIDDQSMYRLLLTRTLRGAGYAVETARSCEEALEKCRRLRFDAITLDMMLPDGPGWDLLARIRSIEHHRETPVIVVSGLESQDLPPVPLGAQGFLTKPFRSGDLLDALEKAGLPMRVVKVANEQ